MDSNYKGMRAGFATVTTLFFMWGFITVSIDPLICQDLFIESYLAQFHDAVRRVAVAGINRADQVLLAAFERGPEIRARIARHSDAPPATSAPGRSAASAAPWGSQGA